MDAPDPTLVAKWLRRAADPDRPNCPKLFAEYITRDGDEKQWAQFAWRLFKETRQVPTRRAVELYIRKRKGQSNDVQEVDESRVAAVESHFLDSGSFTLWTRAKEWAKKEGKREQDFYDTSEHWEYLDGYATFVKAYPEGIDLYANVDAIGYPDITRRNQLYLESEHGLTPVPVVHYRSDLSYLRYYVERGDPVVALGGLVGSTDQDHCRAWIDRCFDYVCNTPNRLPRTKVHGFGVTTHSLLWRFPWYSVDSTAWTKVGAFGGILVPHKRKGAWDFREEPYVMKVSDDTPDKRKAGRHFYTLRQAEQTIIREWLSHINVPLGRVAKDGTVEEDGVVSHHSFRKVANLYFFEGLRAALPAYPWPFRSTRRRGFFS